jgi:hypothetical protein
VSPGARVAAGVLVAILAVLYLSGAFDKALYPLGLNVQDCGQNGFGAVYCGDDLKDYEEEVAKPAERAGREAERIGREARRTAREAACIGNPTSPQCLGY